MSDSLKEQYASTPLFGANASALTIEFNPDYPGFLLAILPPGAFFGLAILIVAKNWFDQRLQKSAVQVDPLPEPA